MAEVVPLDHISYKIDFLRSKNKDLIVVATNGCFDILHLGHIRSLQKAKSFGNILVIGINSDNSVKKIKGDQRPIHEAAYRAEMLASLGCVDFVTIFNEETAENFIKIVKPNIYVKGDDYNVDNIPEAKIVKNQGGKVIQIPNIPGYSTTSLINKIKKF